MQESVAQIGTRLRSNSTALLCGRILMAVLAAALLNLPYLALPARAYSVPYSDPNATGVIGFCDAHGNAIDHGSISDQPFVWLAVSSSPTPREFNYPGKTATLYAFQPRQGEDPGIWSGEQLTAASYYTNGAHPMVEASSDAESIKQFLASYPATWDGLVQIRMFLGSPDNGIHTDTYPATDIRVQGDTWTVVHGGTVSCTAGYAISSMNGDPPSSTATSSPAPAPGSASTPPSSGGPTASGQASPGASVSGRTPGSGGTATGTNAPSSSGVSSPVRAAPVVANSPSSSGPLLAVLIAALALIGAGILVWRIRRPKSGKSGP